MILRSDVIRVTQCENSTDVLHIGLSGVHSCTVCSFHFRVLLYNDTVSETISTSTKLSSEQPVVQPHSPVLNQYINLDGRVFEPGTPGLVIPRVTKTHSY